MPDIVILQQDLATVKARLTLAEEARTAALQKIDTLSLRMEEAQTARIQAETLNGRLSKNLGDTELELKKARDQLRIQEGELGRLRAIGETLTSVQANRDLLVKELAQLKADIEPRIADEVRRAVEKVNLEHTAIAAQWARENTRNLAEIASLRKKFEQSGTTNFVFPSMLATKLAKVLEEKSASIQVPGRLYDIDLTSLEVEARGVLESPRSNEEEPRFVTVESGSPDSATLSTLRMSFKKLPRLAPREE